MNRDPATRADHSEERRTKPKEEYFWIQTDSLRIVALVALIAVALFSTFYKWAQADATSFGVFGGFCAIAAILCIIAILACDGAALSDLQRAVAHSCALLIAILVSATAWRLKWTIPGIASSLVAVTFVLTAAHAIIEGYAEEWSF